MPRLVVLCVLAATVGAPDDAIASIGSPGRFVRGNANDDNRVDIGDAIWIVRFLFKDGPEPRCEDAGDANDDGGVDLSDVVWLVDYRFGGGHPPPPPFPDCAPDPVPDELPCDPGSVTSCPQGPPPPNPPLPPGEDPQLTLRVKIEDAEAFKPTGGVDPYQISVTVPADRVAVEALVDLESELEPCISNPPACNGSENFITRDASSGIPVLFGCSDGRDNDGDGFVDLEDIDCRGVQAWTLAIVTDGCFGIQAATTAGTVADPLTGRRDVESFEQTRLIDPERNDGREGVVNVVVLTVGNLVVLPQIGVSELLRLSGEMDASALEAGAVGEPCAVTVLPGTDPGLLDADIPTPTVISAFGQTRLPGIVNATVRLRAVTP